jgi:hypothetical protein
MRTDKLATTTEIGPPGQAAVAGTTDNQRVKGHAGANHCDLTRRKDSFGRLHDLSGAFVAHDERRHSQTIVAKEATQFGAADPHRTNRDQHFTLGQFWHGLRTLYHFTWAQPHKRLHHLIFHTALLLVLADDHGAVNSTSGRIRHLHSTWLYTIIAISFSARSSAEKGIWISPLSEQLLSLPLLCQLTRQQQTSFLQGAMIAFRCKSRTVEITL